MVILVIDVGGTHVKVLASNRRRALKLPSGPRLTPRQMTRAVRAATKGWRYDAIAIGYPGVVRRGRILQNPVNLGTGWAGFNFTRAFGCPVRVINDAAMQALGAYRGGRMLFLGFGTGLGSALVIDGVLAALELGHLPYRKGRTYEEYVGKAGLVWLGKKKWRRHVRDVILRLQHAFEVEEVVAGGGNAKLIPTFPKGVRRGNNADAFAGGQRLWRPGAHDGRLTRLIRV